MRVSQIAIAIAALGLSATSAFAVCNPAPTITGGDTLTINATDCHLVVNGPAVIPTVTLGGTEVIVRNPLTGEIGSDGGSITGELDRQIAVDVVQDGAITALQSGHAAQQVQIDDHETRITDTETVNATQQTTIDDHTGTLSTHTSQIGDLQTVTGEHETRLNAHDALLSEHAATLKNHGARLDEQEKGIAIAMAMPDTWLSDTERFAVAGNVGFFGDEAALAFAGIARIDQNWSMNAGFGSDTGFKQFGGKVGVRAGW